MRIKRLKEAEHMFVYSDFLTGPSIKRNTKWEPVIKKARLNFRLDFKKSLQYEQIFL